MGLDLRALVAGLAQGAAAEGQTLNRRRDLRDAEATRGREADAASKRALDQLIAVTAAKGPPAADVVVMAGEDENGPGIFAIDKIKKTKTRIKSATDLTPVNAQPPVAPSIAPPEETETHGMTPPPVTPATGSLKPIAKPVAVPKDPLDRKSPIPIKVNGAVTQAMVDGHGKFTDAMGQPITGKIEHYETPKEPGVIPVQRGDGQGGVETVLAPKVVGQVVPGPNTKTPAAIQKSIADNRAQMALIDDAAKELDAHPDAVGGKRALGDVVPLLGGVSDYINQRADSGGVAARAQLANMSSMIIKDRSGSAVTVSEFPRLAPFVPRVGDTPATIRVKLAKLKQGIETETKLLEQGGGGGSTVQSKVSITRAEFAALKAQGFSDEQLNAKYTIKP